MTDKSKARKGATFSDEHRARLREAWARRKARQTKETQTS